MLEQLISQACDTAHAIEPEAFGPAVGAELPHAASETRWAEDPERSAMLAVRVTPTFDFCRCTSVDWSLHACIHLSEDFALRCLCVTGVHVEIATMQMAKLGPRLLPSR